MKCLRDPSTKPFCLRSAHLAISKQTGGLTHYYTVLKLVKVQTKGHGCASEYLYTVTFETAPSTCAIADGPYSSELCKPTTNKACATCAATFSQHHAPVPPTLVSFRCHK
ncbi:hypothetical protein MTO96_034549 [Rhipicephalus appendiculatus]